MRMEDGVGANMWADNWPAAPAASGVSLLPEDSGWVTAVNNIYSRKLFGRQWNTPLCLEDRWDMRKNRKRPQSLGELLHRWWMVSHSVRSTAGRSSSACLRAGGQYCVFLIVLPVVWNRWAKSNTAVSSAFQERTLDHLEDERSQKQIKWIDELGHSDSKERQAASISGSLLKGDRSLLKWQRLRFCSLRAINTSIKSSSILVFCFKVQTETTTGGFWELGALRFSYRSWRQKMFQTYVKQNVMIYSSLFFG